MPNANWPSANVGIYARGGYLLIVPRSSPDGGAWYEHGPLRQVEEEDSGLAEATLAALGDSTVGPPFPTPEVQGGNEKATWRAFKSRSRRQFMDGTSTVTVLRRAGVIEIAPSRLESLRTGWVPIKGAAQQLESPSAEELDLAIRHALTLASS